MNPNFQKYRHHLQNLELSEKDEVELMQALWLILEGFADRAFDPAAPALGMPPMREFPNRPPRGVELSGRIHGRNRLTIDFSDSIRGKDTDEN
jgi:hypothetical protein